MAQVQLLPQGPQGRVALCRLLKPAIATMEPTSTISHDRSRIYVVSNISIGYQYAASFTSNFTMFYQFLHPLFPWLIHGFFSDLLFFFPCCEKSRSAVARSLGSDRSTSGLRVITLPSFPWKFLAFCSAPKPPEPLGMLDFGHVLRWWISAEIEG